MGRIAAENADRVIVTDDNPRSEQPAAIRAAILARQPAPPKSATAPRRSAPASPAKTASAADRAGQGNENDWANSTGGSTTAAFPINGRRAAAWPWQWF